MCRCAAAFGWHRRQRIVPKITYSARNAKSAHRQMVPPPDEQEEAAIIRGSDYSPVHSGSWRSDLGDIEFDVARERVGVA